MTRPLFLVASLLLLSGCPQNAVKQIGFGTFADGVYTNDYFPLTIKLPTNWANQSEEQRQAMMAEGAEMMAGDDQGMKSALKASEMRSICLFSMFKHEPGSPVQSNPNILGIAESLGYLTGIRTGKDYQFHAKNLMEMSQVPYEFTDPSYPETINGTPFEVMPVRLNVGPTSLQQLYYSTVKKGYALSFILTYWTDEELAELKGYLSTLELPGN